ncbi:choice-of-anchor L domain-containing protein [Mangrovimonas sp. YM274]|uniref:choice-of-anchor L domain-containing protein n=1 Tax=Mangrovimonas sp. YM274 TaxID=3070660 RepID=UPI0027DB10CC|nr:choice-of-anchor L domain-containing protein [Mangrovimonas sp. YM274]WMI68759.1 choice-of-anchor L domain-containing protein [Mangrovimonas sp. YM274]
MKKLLVFLVLLSVFSPLNAQVTIGTGNIETENAPFDPYFGYSYTQTVYLASEINASGAITDIQWYYSGSTGLPNSQELVIYMAESPKASFDSTTDWLPIGSFTEVYSGGITVTAGTSGWVQITLDTPFDYTGMENLIIAVEENQTNYDEWNDDFYNTEVATNRTISRYTSIEDPDPVSPPAANNINNFIPNIILGGISELCPNPTNVAVAIDLETADFSWNGGTATAWEVINQEVGGAAPTNTDSGTSVDASTYQITDLTMGADYDFYVRAVCGDDGNSFWIGPLTYHVSNFGENCSTPIVVSNLPYNSVDNTSNYLDDYSGAPGSDCGATAAFLSGDDVVYAFSPAEDTSIDIQLTGLTNGYAGMFLYTDCADIGTACIGGDSNFNTTEDLVIDNIVVPGGDTYYIVISTWANPQSVGYTLNITENTCIDQQVAFEVVSDCANGPQFYIEADVTSMGSATALTLTDNQGSAAQTVNDLGIYTFGPYDNTTNVVITSANVDDVNCTLESAGLTQPYCTENIVDCTVGPVSTTFCYGNNNDIVFTYTSTDGSPLALTVNAGSVQNNLDYFIVYDTDGTTELTAPNTTGTLSGQFESSGDTISFTVSSNGYGSCQSSSTYEPIEVTVACATCTNPQWTYEVVSDCINGPQFNIEVDLSDMGTGTSYTISDDQGLYAETVTAIGIYTVGPFDNMTDVALTIENDNDVNCILTGDTVTQEFCLDNYVNCSEGPLNGTYCYENNDQNVFTFTSNDGSSLFFNINSGTVENNWDALHIYDTDGTELTPSDYYGNGGDLSGLIWQSSGDTISFWIESNGGTSCTSGSQTELDYTVTCATCDLPTWSYDIVSDCINGPQFNIEVDLSDMGSATSYTITDDQGSAAQTATATGIYTFGPYTNETEVSFTIVNDGDALCTLSGEPVTQPFCLDNYLDCSAQEPINIAYCYGDDDTNVFTFTSNDGMALNFEVNSGELYVVGDYFHVYDTDGTELTPNEFIGLDDDGDLTGISYQSSGDTISFWVESNGFASCQSVWTDFELLDITVACASCINPEASYEVVNDCENGEQFLVEVEVTNMGSAESLTISSDYDSNTVIAEALGTYQIGPFPFNTDVEIAVINTDDATCDIYSPIFNMLACPPENDNPCNAIAVEVNELDECTLFASGTIAGAAPSAVGVPACSGQPNDDVWFTFVANAEAQVVSLNNIANGNLNLDYSVYEGTCDGALTELFCSDANVNAVEGLTVGNTYYVRVYSFNDTATTTNFEICIKPLPGNIITDQVTYTVEQLVTDVLISNECAQISNISYSTGTDYESVNGIAYFYTESPGFPFDDGIMLASGNASLADGPNVSTTASSGSWDWPGDMDLEEFVNGNTYNASIIEFDFVPFADEISFDFIMASEEYNGASFECNYSDAFAFLLTDEAGVTTNLAVLPGTTTPILVTNIHPQNTACGPMNEQYFGGYTPDDLPPMIYDGRTVEFTAFSEVNVGETYHIKLVMADEGDSALDSAVFLRAGSFDLGTFDLGIDITQANGNAVCQGESIILSTGADSVEHVWYKDGFVVEGETGSTLEITEGGQYSAQVIFSPTCTEDDTIFVEFIPSPAISEPMDLEVCSETQIGVFDLTENDILVLGELDASLYTISYHLTEQEAMDDVNPLTSPYTNISSPQTVWVRVLSLETGCVSYDTFELILTAPTHTATSVDLLECDNDGDGVAEYDLDAHSTYILDGQDAAAYNVTYYASEQDAMDAANPLASPYTSAGNETVWVRVETVGLPDCYVTNSFMLTIGTSPMTSFTEDFEYIVCIGDDVPVTIEATPENYTEDEVSINWYQDEVLIEGEHGLTLPVLEAGLYEIEVIFNDTGCIAITEQVMESVVCEFPQGISPNGDGLNDSFELSNFQVHRIEIFNRYGTLVYSKNDYTNEWYGQTNDGDELPVGTYFYTIEYGEGQTHCAWVYINK